MTPSSSSSATRNNWPTGRVREWRPPRHPISVPAKRQPPARFPASARINNRRTERSGVADLSDERSPSHVDRVRHRRWNHLPKESAEADRLKVAGQIASATAVRAPHRLDGQLIGPTAPDRRQPGRGLNLAAASARDTRNKRRVGFALVSHGTRRHHAEHRPSEHSDSPQRDVATGSDGN
jgi:hypothetical protein